MTDVGRPTPSDSGRPCRRMAALSEPGPGVTRLAYTALERQAHAQFAEWMVDAGCEVTVDPAGNTIATRPGRIDGPAVGTGSHLDSVYNGGRFDGIAGTMAAVEVARLLHDGRGRDRAAAPLRRLRRRGGGAVRPGLLRLQAGGRALVARRARRAAAIATASRWPRR